MIAEGNRVFERLSANLGSETSASSHWQKYHEGFSFTGDGFVGVEGFGGRARPASRLRAPIHRWLQGRYRRMGAGMATMPTLDALAAEITSRENRDYNLDVLRQVLSLGLLRQTLSQLRWGDLRACVIGDGFGTMTSLLVESGAVKQVILVNLTKTLMVDLWYLRRLWGEENFDKRVRLVENRDQLEQAQVIEGISVIAVEARNSELIAGLAVDLAINIASMQEMDPPVITSYFDVLRQSAEKSPHGLYFYCCNRLEKTLPDGTLVRFDAYPWSVRDRVVLNELCPWHQTFYTMRPPFHRPYDGPIMHRICRLAA